MSLLLADAFEHESLKAAEPVLRTDVPEALSRQLRWVHSSEVLDIAPLLRGGELLLSGGQALATASDERRVDYVRQLAARGITALAIETGPELPAIPESMLDAGQDAGLPIIELRKVAPFVGIMQAINSLLVSESVAQLQFGDETSHAMAAELAHGGGLDHLLAVLASRTGSSARLVSPSGITLGSATAAAQSGPSDVTTVDVPVRGVLAARLELEVPDDGDANLARVAGERCVDILGLALLQRMPPGLKELAGIELMRAISSGTQSWRLQQLGPASGFPASGPVAAVVVRSSAAGQLRTQLDGILHDAVPQSASYADNAELIALAALPHAKAVASRIALIQALQALETPDGSVIAVGPVAQGIGEAPWSLAEARRTLELASGMGAGSGDVTGVVDAEDFAVERLAEGSLDAAAREGFVRRQLGAVVEHDEQRRSELMRTLAVWLDTGCNTAQAARELHLERQSMHHRLQRIFELCGGDPRGTGRLVALHLATRLARL
ncbi:PucR family transcriptional regulator [Arthrobacter sp. B2a2-09]|uniref:PucR family transcriptional regulator n=1 Tax=Arthrobacter sp. B2a2-09 TaxID=2952822 RepID=UPI0022CD445F|nr:PucR family transcriptional regulator ligand-binding domain-containing protein [Arthrobacter sp. B2a2-09]MCZ9885028.1 PucR family transcriptional regulator ligand-binding domain-containing protein [Arthrobacter sp. B2a2-09]